MFGNRKRIIELERQVEVLARRENNNILNEALLKMDNAFKDYLVHDVAPCKCPIDYETAEICFNCRIKTGETTVNHDALGAAKTITTHYIPSKEAIEKIMDHLGLEFDHIEATNPDTVIKPKETP